MKLTKSIICFAIVFIALSVTCKLCNGWQSSGEHYTTTLNGLTDWLPIIAILSLIAGFIPAYAHEYLKEMKGQNIMAAEPVPAQSIYVGQTATFEDCKCTFRIKAIHNIDITPANYINLGY